MNENQDQGKENKISGALELFAVAILLAILGLQLLITIGFEPSKPLTGLSSLKIGFVMWVVFAGSYLQTRASESVRLKEKPRKLWFVEVVCLILLMGSLAGAFAPSVEMFAHFANVVVVLLVLFMIWWRSCERSPRSKERKSSQ